MMVELRAFGQCRARPVDRIQGASGAYDEDGQTQRLGKQSKYVDLTIKNPDLMGLQWDCIGITMGFS